MLCSIPDLSCALPTSHHRGRKGFDIALNLLFAMAFLASTSGDPPNPGIKPASPALQVDSLPSEPPGKSPSNRPATPLFSPACWDHQLRSGLPFGPRSQASLQKAQGPGVCKLPKPPASRALCQAFSRNHLWTSLVAQMVRNPPAMQEMQV